MGDYFFFIAKCIFVLSQLGAKYALSRNSKSTACVQLLNNAYITLHLYKTITKILFIFLSMKKPRDALIYRYHFIFM